jgi:hypothetical protein
MRRPADPRRTGNAAPSPCFLNYHVSQASELKGFATLAEAEVAAKMDGFIWLDYSHPTNSCCAELTCSQSRRPPEPGGGDYLTGALVVGAAAHAVSNVATPAISAPTLESFEKQGLTSMTDSSVLFRVAVRIQEVAAGAVKVAVVDHDYSGNQPVAGTDRRCSQVTAGEPALRSRKPTWAENLVIVALQES